MARSFVHYKKVSSYKDKRTYNKTSPRAESDTSLVVDVAKVVSDLVEYVIRKQEIEAIDIQFDDEAIPPTQGDSVRADCSKDYCTKGCICSCRMKKATHCKKEECIFKCICNDRLVYSLRKLPHRAMDRRKNSTGAKKAAKSSQQSPNNTKSSKRRRLTSEPTNVSSDDVSTNEEHEVIEIPDDDTIEISDTEKDDSENTKFLNASFDSLKMSDRKKMEKLSYVRTRLLNMTEVFIWCMLHRRYSCRCTGTIFDMRTGALFSQPEMDYLATDNVLKHQIFDSKRHSSRTFGSWFDYRLRNGSYLFGVKRCVETINGVLSNTNSFFKIEVPLRNGDSEETITKEHSAVANENAPDGPSDTGGRRRPIFRYSFSGGSSSASDDEQYKHIPNKGLLCLNHSFGYLPIKEFTSNKLVFQNPINKSIFVCCRNVSEANRWLDDFFKRQMIFESADTKLKWVVVEKPILKSMKPFDKSLLDEKSKIINSQGFLVNTFPLPLIRNGP